MSAYEIPVPVDFAVLPRPGDDEEELAAFQLVKQGLPDGAYATGPDGELLLSRAVLLQRATAMDMGLTELLRVLHGHVTRVTAKVTVTHPPA